MAAYIGDNLPTSWALQGATQTSLHNCWLPTWSGTTVCMPHKAQFDQKRRSRADTHELTAIAFVAFGLVGCPASASMRHRGSTAARAHASEGAGVCGWFVPASRRPRAGSPEPTHSTSRNPNKTRPHTDNNSHTIWPISRLLCMACQEWNVHRRRVLSLCCVSLPVRVPIDKDVTATLPKRSGHHGDEILQCPG